MDRLEGGRRRRVQEVAHFLNSLRALREVGPHFAVNVRSCDHRL